MSDITPVDVPLEDFVAPVVETPVVETPADAIPVPEVPETPQFKFGFVVLVDQEGGVFIEKNAASLLSIPIERESSLIEVRRYTSEILMDLQAQASAEYTTLRIKAEEAQAPQTA